MKKLIILSLFVGSFSLSACTGTAGEPVRDTSGSATGADEGKVVPIDAAAFRKLIWDYQKDPQNWAYSGEIPCIVDFYADWCRPCKMISPILDQIAKDYKGKLVIYKVNTDEQRELSSVFNIRSIPAVLFVPRAGKPQMFVGALSKEAYLESVKTVLKVQ
jgi:thioredoxin 1